MLCWKSLIICANCKVHVIRVSFSAYNPIEDNMQPVERSLHEPTKISEVQIFVGISYFWTKFKLLEWR